MLDPLQHDIPEYHFVDESELVNEEALKDVIDEADFENDLFLSISTLVDDQAGQAEAPAAEEEENDDQQ